MFRTFDVGMGSVNSDRRRMCEISGQARRGGSARTRRLWSLDVRRAGFVRSRTPPGALDNAPTRGMLCQTLNL
jgi:hypothetical protein